MRTKKLAQLGLLSAVALILFVVEAQIPSPIPVPGIKLGIANIVTVFAVFCLGSREAALVLAVRVFRPKVVFRILEAKMVCITSTMYSLSSTVLNIY